MQEIRTDREWERRFRLSLVLTTQIARLRSERGLAIAVMGGSYQLYAWHVPEGRLTQLTFGSANIQRGHLSADGEHVYYLHDKAGGERGHYARVPFEGGDPEDISPNLPPYASLVFTSSGDGSTLAYVALTTAGAQLYLQRVGPSGVLGAPQLLHQADHLGSTILSADADLVTFYQPDRRGNIASSIRVLETTSGATLATIRDGEESHIVPIAFCPLASDPRFLATSDRSGQTRPFICDTRTGERADLRLDALAGDVIPLDWSDDGQTLLLCHQARAQERLYRYDLATHRLHALAHPSGSVTSRLSDSGTYFAPGGTEIYVQWENGAQPPQVMAIDAQTGKQTRSVLRLGEETPGHAWQSVEFASSDGVLIQGWLGLPGDGERPTDPVPTILYLHGGPFTVQRDWYLLAAETWLDAGFAFLALNYRGSTTFGTEFMRAIMGDAGYWELEDMAAAHHWLVAHSIARPDQIILHGHSYGGYLTLLALGKQPELWAGGIPVGPVTDWATLVEEALPTISISAAILLGGSPQSVPERYQERSPLTYADQVRAPILAIHGRNDPRTPASQMQRYEARLRELGKSIEVMWFEEGHYNGGREQMIAQQDRMLEFTRQIATRQNGRSS
ncbi:MAG TPA: alpha/beta fold hydrolase [Ktedonobacterales bacterium]|jgi:dipeptidyl aminopeptidase/acylaminoacyl peptidase